MIWIWVLYEQNDSRMSLNKQFSSVLKRREVCDNRRHYSTLQCSKWDMKIYKYGTSLISLTVVI